MAVRTQCVASKHNGGGLSDSCENPFDWTYEELKGRATGIYLPMDRDEVLVKDGECSEKRVDFERLTKFPTIGFGEGGNREGGRREEDVCTWAWVIVYYSLVL